MHIQSVTVKNFKSLVDFNLDLARFNCLIGLNGSGTSTVLQFFDFLSHLVRGDMKSWLDARRWKAVELRSKLPPRRSRIEFSIQFDNVDDGIVRSWDASFDSKLLRCVSERVKVGGNLIETDGKSIQIYRVLGVAQKLKDFDSSLAFEYEGSILASLKEEWLPKPMLELKRFLTGIESLDTLTPELLRQRTRSADGSLGHGGKNLSAFVYELGVAGRKRLTAELKAAYPRLDHVLAKSLRSGWKQLQASELFDGAKLWTEARHLNDGMLRLIAILAELASEHELVLFDEVENGINPELVEFVLDQLVNAQQQVLVSTHSPMILNYLSDDIARQGVVYLYRTARGHTKAIPFFSIPSLAEKLKVMGPGEAFADTNLTELAEEIESVKRENP